MGRGCLYFTGMNVFGTFSLWAPNGCTVCILRCQHARFCVEVYMSHIYIFIHHHQKLQTGI